jgi:hypothetical protein
MSEFKKKERKGGFLAPLMNLLGRGTPAVGGTSGFGSGLGGFGSGLGGLSGLFATKAGILGMVLGAATIAAGVGVVYNFIGPSARPAYGPQLFQDTYYAEQANNAGLERAGQKDHNPAAEPSTLDLFREQAKKDGLGFAGEGGGSAGEGGTATPAGPSGAAPADGNSPAAGAASADSSADAPAAHGKLLPASGLSGGAGAGGGGSAANAPKLSFDASKYDGVVKKFDPIYKAPAGQQGKSTAMKRSLAAIVRGSAKSEVPSGKKGSYGQAKFAGKIGSRAIYSADTAGAKTAATQAFSGETVGAGDVGAAGGGVGLGGAGITGDQLKSSDPSMSNSQYTPPSVTDAANDSPWKYVTNAAMIGMIAGALLLAMAQMLMKQAKAKEKEGTPESQQQAQVLKGFAIGVAAAAMAAGGLVVACGVAMMFAHDQRWTGFAYALCGAAIIAKAAKIMASAGEKADSSEDIAEDNTAQGLANTTGGDLQLGAGTSGNTGNVTNQTSKDEYKGN